MVAVSYRYKYMKLKDQVLIIFLILTMQNLSFSAEMCLRHYNRSQIQFIKYPDDSFMAFRSNAPHYWSFVKRLTNEPKFSSLFQLKGVGIGDFHFLNIADIELKNHQRKIGLIDMDDAGKTIPLLFDMARQLVALSLTPAKDDLPNYIKAFFHGIKNTPTSSDFIKSIQRKSPEDFDKKFQKMMDKYITNNRFNKDSDIEPLSTAPKTVVKLFERMESSFTKALSNYDPNFKILDKGFRIKSDGGSQGIPRFVYLIQKGNGNTEIIELKQYIMSAASNYGPQGINRERFESVRKIYRTTEDILGLFDLVEKDDLAFIARTKLPNFIDFKITDDMSKDDKESLQDFVEYSVNQYGLAQRNQLTSAQIKWLTDNKEVIEQQLLDFIKLYKKELFYQNTKEQK